MSRTMQNDYKKLFSYLPEKEAPEWLARGAMLQIEAKKKKGAVYTRIVLFGAMTFIAFIALISVSKEFYSEFAQSGFLQFVSLLFSDAKVVATYWQDFLMSLAESLPVFATVGIFGSVFLLLFSIRQLLLNIRATMKSTFATI